MYEPVENRRRGITKRYELDNTKFYVNIQYDNSLLPRVVRIFSDMKYGSQFSDMCIDLSDNITERLQIRKDPMDSLSRMAKAAPRRTSGEAATIQGLIIDELIKSYYLED
tara:strand:- start:670 stop:999 length:330 start_codon:yes stop_codon:yes gene_type:complete